MRILWKFITLGCWISDILRLFNTEDCIGDYIERDFRLLHFYLGYRLFNKPLVLHLPDPNKFWSNVPSNVSRCSISRLAAALVSYPLWVMNIVPVTAPDTLPIIFDRGLIGMYHDWCEPHSTYPRSYDVMHSDHLLSTLTKRCPSCLTTLSFTAHHSPGLLCLLC